MQSFGARTLKPTMVITNSQVYARLRGRRLKRGKKSLCRRHKNSQGKPAFSGTKHLKKSQNLGWQFNAPKGGFCQRVVGQPPTQLCFEQCCTRDQGCILLVLLVPLWKESPPVGWRMIGSLRRMFFGRT